MNIAGQDFLKFPLGLEQATHMASYHLILFIFFFKQNLSSIEGVWFALSISAHTLAAFFLYDSILQTCLSSSASSIIRDKFLAVGLNLHGSQLCQKF